MINRTMQIVLTPISLVIALVVGAPMVFTPAQAGAAGALRCVAYTTKTAHSGYSTETVHIQTSAGARISGAAHYQGMTRVETTTANASGATLMTFRNPSTHSRFHVVIDLTVKLGTARSSCVTAFTLG